MHEKGGSFQLPFRCPNPPNVPLQDKSQAAQQQMLQELQAQETGSAELAESLQASRAARQELDALKVKHATPEQRVVDLEAVNAQYVATISGLQATLASEQVLCMRRTLVGNQRTGSTTSTNSLMEVGRARCAHPCAQCPGACAFGCIHEP